MVGKAWWEQGSSTPSPQLGSRKQRVRSLLSGPDKIRQLFPVVGHRRASTPCQADNTNHCGEIFETPWNDLSIDFHPSG